MTDRKERVTRKLQRIIDRYGDDIGHADMEVILQRLATEQREQIPEGAVITADKITLNPDENDGADAEN